MFLMLWKRSCAFEPALTTHNFFQNAHSSKVHETPTGTWAELIVFRSKAAWVSVIGDGGSCGLGMAPTIGTLFGAFDVAHYRPKERPDSVRIFHPKTGEEAWWPLFGNTGRPIYPDLTAELDAMKADTVGGPPSQSSSPTLDHAIQANSSFIGALTPLQ
jgi:hypothetical protein